MPSTKLVGSFIAVLVVVACSSNEPTTAALDAADAATDEQKREDFDGYELSPSQSFLKIPDRDLRSSDREMIAENDIGRVVVRANGWVTALRNAGSEAQAPRFSGTMEDHNAAARGVFLERGLPTDQLSVVGGGTVMGLPAVSLADEAKGEIPTEFISYVARASRALDQIPVGDSFAIVSLDGLLQPTMDSVFWPAIPHDIVRQARRFADRLSDGGERNAYLARLGIDMTGREGHVVIRHTSAEFQGPMEFFVVFDVSGLGNQSTLHFDVDGRAVLLPNERVPALSDPVADAGWRPNLGCRIAGSWSVSGASELRATVAEDGRWSYVANDGRIDGELQATDGELAITDRTGQSFTPCVATQVGRYQTLWRNGCTELHLKLVDDVCGGRMKALGGREFQRVDDVPAVLIPGTTAGSATH